MTRPVMLVLAVLLAAPLAGASLVVIRPYIDDDARELCPSRDAPAVRSCRAPLDVDLVFFCSRRGCADDGAAAALDACFASAKAEGCYRSVRHISAGLTDADDFYVSGLQARGPNQQFLRIFRMDEFRPYSHFFYMEPDCVPVREFWLDAMREETLGASGDFWIKGSHFRGTRERHRFGNRDFSLHINGNALYSLQDERFRELVELVLRLYPNMAYDAAIGALLKQSAQFRAEYLPKFVFTDRIQNRAGSRWSRAEIQSQYSRTFIVHGGEETA